MKSENRFKLIFIVVVGILTILSLSTALQRHQLSRKKAEYNEIDKQIKAEGLYYERLVVRGLKMLIKAFSYASCKVFGCKRNDVSRQDESEEITDL
jgi:regulatory protein YycI of two-component signal transduction system YycFG